MTEAVAEMPFPALGTRSASRKESARACRFGDWAFTSLLSLAITSSNYWKDALGPEVVAAIVMACCLYAVSNAFSYRIRFHNRLLAIWSCLGVVYIALSVMRWLPGTPIVFIPDYVLRMGYFTCLVYPATAAFYVFLAKARGAEQFENGGVDMRRRLALGAMTRIIFPRSMTIRGGSKGRTRASRATSSRCLTMASTTSRSCSGGARCCWRSAVRVGWSARLHSCARLKLGANAAACRDRRDSLGLAAAGEDRSPAVADHHHWVSDRRRFGGLAVERSDAGPRHGRPRTLVGRFAPRARPELRLWLRIW